MTEEIKIPKTITKKLFITVGVDSWNSNQISILDFDRTKLSKEVEYVLLKTQEVTFDLSDAEFSDENSIKKEIVKGLEEKKAKIKAETHMKIKEIQDKIDNLLAIEYKPQPEITATECIRRTKERQHPKKNTIGG